MDPLSITSGVIAVIQLATQIISVCQDYITNVQDAPTDLRNIIIEVGSINSVLGVIKLLESQTCHGRDSMILTQLKAPNGALSACEQTLLDLDALIPPLIGHSTNGKRYKIAPLDRLAWPLKVSKARKLLEKIGQLKSTISLALTVDTT
jgi:Fungal N-terminal domain of STAND proteins